jgi:copper chaperone NosL
MNFLPARVVGLAILLLCLTGCNREAPATAPPPIEVSADATGYYCGMLLVQHEGPKGQIHLASRAQPLWFTSVRDTIAFTRLPEEPRDVTAIYVNDMGRAPQWEQPGPGVWVDARAAWFVIESDMEGGMGAPEAVPFSEKGAAERFVLRHGGRIVQLTDIPDRYLLGGAEALQQRPPATSPRAGRH